MWEVKYMCVKVMYMCVGGIDFISVSTIFLLGFGFVSTVWYFILHDSLLAKSEIVVVVAKAIHFQMKWLV